MDDTQDALICMAGVISVVTLLLMPQDPSCFKKEIAAACYGLALFLLFISFVCFGDKRPINKQNTKRQ